LLGGEPNNTKFIFGSDLRGDPIRTELLFDFDRLVGLFGFNVASFESCANV
jgi:hypothetical protein